MNADTTLEIEDKTFERKVLDCDDMKYVGFLVTDILKPFKKEQIMSVDIHLGSLKPHDESTTEYARTLTVKIRTCKRIK